MANITIKDVAKEAGVSIGTVSNALNGNRYINPDTKQRVMDAVKKLNYIPNLNGRYLKAGATKNLGFLALCQVLGCEVRCTRTNTDKRGFFI